MKDEDVKAMIERCHITSFLLGSATGSIAVILQDFENNMPAIAEKKLRALREQLLTDIDKHFYRNF